MSHGVGDDIESMCTRCVGPTWQVIVAKVGDQIAKVECRRCGGQHRYRPTTGDPSKDPVEARRRGGRTLAPRKRPRTATRAPEPEPTFDPSQPPRAYGPTASFRKGERIRHPTFGVGVVTDEPGPGRITVRFPDGSRVLAQAKAAPQLSRGPRAPGAGEEP